MSNWNENLKTGLFSNTAPEMKNIRGRECEDIDLMLLNPFPKHPFRIYKGEQRFDDLVESIREHGVITPLIVRRTDDGELYILSGHNRAEAAKELDFVTVPCIVMDNITDEEALMIVLDTNTKQRGITEMPISEQAKICALDVEINRRQGRRSDLIKDIEENLMQLRKGDDSIVNTHEEVGKKYGLSRNTIARLLRINTLVPELKSRIDNHEISVRAGVEISYTQKSEQEHMERAVSEYGYKLDEKKAKMLRELSAEVKAINQTLDYDTVCEVMEGGKPKRQAKSSMSVTVKAQLLEKYFRSDESKESILNSIDKGMDIFMRAKHMYPALSDEEIHDKILELLNGAADEE